MSAESRLEAAGVFKGADGLRRLAEADHFWDQQAYGTRLYFGDGVADYLHRGVLQAAINALDAEPAQAVNNATGRPEVLPNTTLTPCTFCGQREGRHATWCGRRCPHDGNRCLGPEDRITGTPKCDDNTCWRMDQGIARTDRDAEEAERRDWVQSQEAGE